MAGLGVHGDPAQQVVEIGDVRVGCECTFEGGSRGFIADLGDVFEVREIDDLSVDKTALVVAEVPAIDEQVTRGEAMLELVVGRDDQEVDVRVIPRVALGDRAADDQSEKARVVAVRVSQAVDGLLVVVADLHRRSIATGHACSSPGASR